MSLALLLNKSKTRSQTEDDEVIKELQSNESSAVCDQRNSPTETPVFSDTHTASISKQASSHQASSKSNDGKQNEKTTATDKDGGPQPKQPKIRSFSSKLPITKIIML